MVKRMMTGTKFNIDKFDEKNDFGLWQVRMKALLEQQGLAAALEKLPASMIVAFLVLKGMPYTGYGGRAFLKRGFYREDAVGQDQGYKGFTGGVQQQNGLVKETNMTLLAKVRCFLIKSNISKVSWAEDTTMSTYLVNRSPSSAIGFKTPIDMLGFLGWLDSIKQGMLEPVKVKCKFLRCSEGTGSVQVLQGVEFEMKPREDHAFEVEPLRNVSQEAGLQKVISKWKTGLNEDIDSRSYVYVLRNCCKKSSDDNESYYWEYAPGLMDKAKGNVLGMKIFRDRSGNTLRVSQSKVQNDKLVQTLLEGHSILSLKGSLSGACDVEKN
ncbi:zinc finger, CCHC-type containing protein, partial [Tanacetum coccineum]